MELVYLILPHGRSDHKSSVEEFAKKYKTNFCPGCGKGFYFRKSIRNHRHRTRCGSALKEANLLQCEQCEYSTNAILKMNDHVNLSHPDYYKKFLLDYQVYMCLHCDQLFLTAEQKNDHEMNCLPSGNLPEANGTNMEIENPSTYKTCPHCSNEFTNKKAYVNHLASHVRARPFVCDKCGFSTRLKGKLKCHIGLHRVSETPFLCNECGQTFHTQYDYQEHLEGHQKQEKKARYRKILKQRDKGSFLCPECGAHFDSKQNLQKHCRKHQLKSEDVTCSVCRQVFSEVPSLRYHMVNGNVSIPNTVFH